MPLDRTPKMAYNYGVNSKKWKTIMKSRLLKLSNHYSFFLFGARGTGKSTLLRHLFTEENALWIDLLDPEQEGYFHRDPNALKSIAKDLPKEKSHIVIDEIQKLPKLLDIIHSLIEQMQAGKMPEKIFVMTGSSARKDRKSVV